jgi:CheY-like chemotaxis protein
MERIRDVLVVDDNVDIVDALAMVLGDAGYAVRAAFDGRQALDAVAAQIPALVLLDLRMPIMDGWECARILRDRYGPALRIVAISAAEHTRSDNADAIGVDDVLPKPVDLDVLLGVIAKYLPLDA